MKYHRITCVMLSFWVLSCNSIYASFAEGKEEVKEIAIKMPDGNFWPIRINAATGEIKQYFQGTWQKTDRGMKEYLEYIYKHQTTLVKNDDRE